MATTSLFNLRPHIPKSLKELHEVIRCSPEMPTPELRNADKYQRVLDLATLEDVYIPTSRDIMAATTTLRMLEQGYKHRPITASYWRDHTKACTEFAAMHRKNTMLANGGGRSAAIIGVSGSGKSSLVTNLLNSIPQVIENELTPDSLLPRQQIVWIKVTCPFKGRPKSFINQFFAEVDRLVGSTYQQDYKRDNDDILVGHLGRIVRLHYTGILVVDEIQDVVGRGESTDRDLMRLFVNMTEALKIPLLFIGTPKSQRIIDTELADARRMLGPRWLPFKKDDPDWNILLQELWRYQYTRTESPLDAEIQNTIFDLTQGIPALAKSLYQLAQHRVILTTRKSQPELIDSALLKQTAAEDMSSVAGAVNALRTGKSLDVYDDLLPKTLGDTREGDERREKLVAAAQGVFDSTFLSETKKRARHQAALAIS